MSADDFTQPVKTRKQFEIKSGSAVRVTPLLRSETGEALDFLAVRPLHTVIMSGWIRDYGIVSAAHRGRFYGCRDERGRLTGIALIGRNTLFEVRTHEALAALAEYARECPDIQMVMAEGEKLSKFWYHYARPDRAPRLTCRELLFQIRQSVRYFDDVIDLKPATEEDLDQIVPVHAQMVFEETGIDPLARDAEGFRARCAARVRQGRVWVWTRDGQLVFKTDVVSETPEAVYIEGLWTDPGERGKGYSKRCLASLCRQLSNNSRAVCGFVDVDNLAARALYQKTGFSVQEQYAKIYL